MEWLRPENLGVIGEAVRKAAALTTFLSLALALLQCFFGYKLLRAWVALIGFLVGFFLGLAVAAKFIASGYMPLVVAIIAGILLSIVSFRIYLVGVFLYCGTIASVATWLIPYPAGKNWLILSFVIAVAAFVTAGLLAVKFAKPCIIGISSISGASAAVQAMQKLSLQMAVDQSRALLVFAGLLLAGVAVQSLMNRGK